MKKIFIAVLAAAAMVLGTNANAQLSVGAGFQMQNYKAKIGGTQTMNPMGLYVGLDYTIPFAGNFAVTPGLYYGIGKTDKATMKNGGATLTVKDMDVTAHDLMVPVYVSYNHEFGFGKGFVYAGPSLGYNIDTKSKGDSIYDDGIDFSHFNIGIGLGLGCTFAEHYRLSAGYNFGLLNRYKGDGDFTIKNNFLNVGFNYIF